MQEQKLWQVSTGRADIVWLEHNFKKHEPPFILAYARGSADMKDIPKVGDGVYITCQAKLRCSGVIVEDFSSIYNPNIKEYEEYVLMLIDKVYTDCPYMKGMRRNWTRLKQKPVHE